MAPVASPPKSFLLNVFSASLFFFSHPPLPGPSVSSSNSPTCLSSGGGEQAQLDQFLTPSFLAILRDPAGDPHRAGRLGGVWQERSCIAFSQTLYGPRGFPRDWVSKQRAFEHCRFSSFLRSASNLFHSKVNQIKRRLSFAPARP